MAYTTIKDPSAYFQTKLYTGGTAEAKTFDGNSNLKPDLFWSKKRGAVQNNFLADSVRGTTYALVSNTTGASYTNSETAELTSFDTNGFTFSGTGDTYNGTYQSDSYVAWGWKANGTGVSNTSGSITSTVSASATSGFSIVSYTGNGTDNATVGHGLLQKPDMVIIKARENTSSWLTWHKDLTGAGYAVFLDGTDAQANYNILKNQSSSVLTLSTNSAVNANNQGFTSYNFHSVQGYSKFGKYYSNNSSNGPFIYTGFKPSFIMIKNINGARDWRIYDNKRAGYNNKNYYLEPNTSDAEGTTDSGSNWDMLSNGFKFYTSEAEINGGVGNEYLYMAFAEQPLVGDNPATAR